MTPVATEFQAKYAKRFSDFRKALTSESDRGCALFAAAYLDKSLSDLLYVSLVENKKIEEDLFKSQGPLSTFSARIKFAYYLGKISPSERRDLDVIRAIRNDFAHHAEEMTFDIQSVRDRCTNLVHQWHEASARPRGKFTAAVSGLLASIHAETFKAVALTEKKDIPIPEEMKQKIRLEAQTKVEAICRAIQRNSNNDAA